MQRIEDAVRNRLLMRTLFTPFCIPAELTGVPPLTFRTAGYALKYWSITGNSGGVGDRTPQMFQAAQAEDGYRIANSDGQNYADASCFVSEYIPVSERTTYTKNSPGEDAFHRFAFYNSNHSFLSSSNSNTVTTPAGTAFLRFCGRISEKNKTVLNQGDAPLPIEPYGMYRIPISCGGVTVKLYIPSPLMNGEVLHSTDMEFPTIPTQPGENLLTVDTEIQPAEMTIRFLA